MIFKGKVHKNIKSESCQLVEIPLLDLMTQGEDPEDCLLMVVDAIESLDPTLKGKLSTKWADKKKSDFFLICEDPKIIGMLLQRQRIASGMTVKEAAKKLGFKSHNSISAYEQGEREPTISKLSQILSAYGKHFELGSEHRFQPCRNDHASLRQAN